MGSLNPFVCQDDGHLVRSGHLVGSLWWMMKDAWFVMRKCWDTGTDSQVETKAACTTMEGILLARDLSA